MNTLLLSAVSLLHSLSFGAPYTAGVESNYYLPPQTHFTMRNYFANLSENTPDNRFGSCGFVALSSILSYADTFYNDNLIAEHFEEKTNFSSFDAAYLGESPGLKNYSAEYSFQDLYNHVINSYQYDYQSYMLYNYNISLGHISYNNFTSGYYPGHAREVYQSVLPNTYIPEVTAFSADTQDDYYNFLRNCIDSNIPVLTAICHREYDDDDTFTDTLHHGVVVYDYDDNGIYANFGLGAGTTHVNLLDNSQNYNYNHIFYCEAIDFSHIIRYHSDNYIINSRAYCGSNCNESVTIVPSVAPGNYPFAIAWQEVSPNSLEEHFSVTLGLFNSSNNSEVVFTYETTANCLNLSQDLVAYFNEYASSGIFVTIQRFVDDTFFVPQTTFFI
ncbi:MAG: hypothetical protein K5762_00585 [Bacilli bacterium]|nr:hypothetical protein [Bacilli bacterium]